VLEWLGEGGMTGGGGRGVGGAGEKDMSAHGGAAKIIYGSRGGRGEGGW